MALRKGGGGEIAVPRGDDEIGVVDGRGGCEVDGVVAAQRVALGKLSGGARERLVESDDVQLVEQPVDRPDRDAQRARVDPPVPMRGRRSSTRLGVDKMARRDGLGAIPQLGGDVRARLVEDELDQRRSD